MSDSFEPEELVDDYHFAAIIDEKVSTLRHWLKEDPSRLPAPMHLSGVAYWPWAQLQAWIVAGEPRLFDLRAKDFVPAPIWRASDEFTNARKRVQARIKTQ
jgi:hypothetical protein